MRLWGLRCGKTKVYPDISAVSSTFVQSRKGRYGSRDVTLAHLKRIKKGCCADTCGKCCSVCPVAYIE